MEIEKFIADFEGSVEDVEPGSLDATTAFKALQSWDSLAVLTVTDTIDMEYGVLLRKPDFESVSTLLELFNLVQQKHSA